MLLRGACKTVKTECFVLLELISYRMSELKLFISCPLIIDSIDD